MKELCSQGRSDIIRCRLNWKRLGNKNTSLTTQFNTVKYEKKVIEENTSAKRVAKLEAEVEKLHTRATNAENALPTSQDAYKRIALAFDKQEQEFEDKVKQAVEFKPVMEKLLKESVMLTTRALINLPSPSQSESDLTPLAQLRSRVASAPQSIIPLTIVGEANKG